MAVHFGFPNGRLVHIVDFMSCVDFGYVYLGWYPHKETYCIIAFSEKYHTGEIQMISFTTLISALNNSEQLSA